MILLLISMLKISKSPAMQRLKSAWDALGDIADELGPHGIKDDNDHLTDRLYDLQKSLKPLEQNFNKLEKKLIALKKKLETRDNPTLQGNDKTKHFRKLCSEIASLITSEIARKLALIMAYGGLKTSEAYLYLQLIPGLSSIFGHAWAGAQLQTVVTNWTGFIGNFIPTGLSTAIIGYTGMVSASTYVVLIAMTGLIIIEGIYYLLKPKYESNSLLNSSLFKSTICKFLTWLPTSIREDFLYYVIPLLFATIATQVDVSSLMAAIINLSQNLGIIGKTFTFGQGLGAERLGRIFSPFFDPVRWCPRNYRFIQN